MDQYKVQPNAKINLAEWDPRDTNAFNGDKRMAKVHLKSLNSDIESLQELLYAEGKRKLLIVLQGMDTSGKDGTIRAVFEGVNPQGVKVAPFGKPTEEELDHDYLWRVHKHTPGRGKITIFNRSHYEDVLVVRVHNLVPPQVWQKRYHHIREFERTLADEGTTIIKFFLHISRKEQKERFLARIETPEKQWKFNKGDIAERARWPQYMEAFEAVLNQTSTEFAPWFIIPADRKWYRNLVIASILKETLTGFNMQYPSPEEGLDQIVIPD